MSDFKFHPKIHSSYTEELTNLFFFNERQKENYDQIVRVVERFGEPIVVKEGDYISMSIAGRPDSKSIFVSFGPALIGAIIYLIEPHDTMQVVHFVIDTKFKKNGRKDNSFLTLIILEHLKDIAKRFHTKKINILYSKKPLVIDIN